MRAPTYPAVIAAHLDARDALRVEFALRVRPRYGARGEEEGGEVFRGVHYMGPEVR